MGVGARIMERRIELGFSRTRLSEESGVLHRRLKAIEEERRIPRDPTLEKLGAALGLDAGEVERWKMQRQMLKRLAAAETPAREAREYAREVRAIVEASLEPEHFHWATKERVCQRAYEIAAKRFRPSSIS